MFALPLPSKSSSNHLASLLGLLEKDDSNISVAGTASGHVSATSTQQKGYTVAGNAPAAAAASSDKVYWWDHLVDAGDEGSAGGYTT